MPELKPNHISPTDEEEAEIQRQIAEDPEDSAHWKNATPLRPAIEVMPDVVERHRPGRGKQKVPTKLKPGHISPTDEEEAAIQKQIAEDPDDFELDDDWFRRARPAIEVMPHLVERHRPGRGKQKAPTKEKVTVRLDSDIVAHFRSTGRGWQTRLNEALRKSVIGL